MNEPSDEVSAISHADMANALRVLAIDAVERAASGHPGMPMGMADVACVLFTRFLKFDSREPGWPDRDRFILSAGHGSMLLYGLLHLCGYEDMPISEIEKFRQLDSKAAGHPEWGLASGIETTTGPLGQGLANAVGMALGERILNSRFGDGIVDHRTYALVSDGDLMEGISHEAIALAGHLKLGRLIVLWDDNRISIDGETSLADSSDVPLRFESAGWHVVDVDGHDPEAIEAAIAKAVEADKPSLVACRTIIGYGAPSKQNSAACHGSPLGAEESSAARRQLKWQHAPFVIPERIIDAWRLAGLRGGRARSAWQKRVDSLPEDAGDSFRRTMEGDLPCDLPEAFHKYKNTVAQAKEVIASRTASLNTLEAVAEVVPELLGGSADLTGSTATRPAKMSAITSQDFSGRFIHYGVREHGMVAVMNGLALHGGCIPYGGTFLVFSDYCRPALRLAALMGLRVILVATHDSIGVGEDGPTHQPVEHLASLRAIPNLLVLRPADALETAECWEVALAQKHRPSVLVLSRQKLPSVRTSVPDENPCLQGAYELSGSSGNAQVSLLASGSEMSIALEAQEILLERGISSRVVSVPCLNLFAEQEQAYQEDVLGPGTIRIAVEAGVRYGWGAYVGVEGDFLGMRSFGASAPAGDLYKHFGITAEELAKLAQERLERRERNGGDNGRGG